MHSHSVTYPNQITPSFQKRKKSSYLSSGVPPPTRQLTRSLRTESRLEEKPPSSSSQDKNTGAQHRRASPQTTASSTSGPLSLHIPGLPASLTIERVQTSLCVVCRKPGEWSGFNWLLLIFGATTKVWECADQQRKSQLFHLVCYGYVHLHWYSCNTTCAYFSHLCVPGSLNECSSCSVEYHMNCATSSDQCPQCSVKQSCSTSSLKGMFIACNVANCCT